MNLLSETVTVRDTAFEVRELTMKGLGPILSKMADDPAAAQMDMLAACVHLDGVPLGAASEDLPGACFRPLIAAVMRVNGITGEDNEGNVPAP